MKIHVRLASSSLLLATALLSGASPSEAQDKKVSLYAGYAYLRTDDGNLNGVRLSPEYRLNGLASVVADGSFEKGTLAGSSTTISTYMGGLRLHRSLGAATVFVHGLAGSVRTSASVKPFGGVSISVSESHIGYDGGGGLEFKFKGAMKLRFGADYLRHKVDIAGGKTADQSDIRASVGFVF
jgi:opacity protein-like surface antigen